MMNQDNPYAMNQTCKVCGEPAAGFHFGAFTCEGCKSFFGRSYNNLSSISDCKNNGECIINKKNRTACKACRLRKCLLVGMSKSGSRYGRRSNWFKIHCLLQEQQQQAAAALAAHHHNSQQQHQSGGSGSIGGAGKVSSGLPMGMPPGAGIPPPGSAAAAALGMLGHHAAAAYPGLFPPRTKEELMMLGLEDYAAAAAAAANKHPTASPSVSSPESHNSDSSAEVNVRGNSLMHFSGKHASNAMETAAAAVSGASNQLRKDLPPFLPLPFPGGLGGMPVMPPPPFLPPTHLLFPGYHPALYSHHQGLLKPLPEQQQAAAAVAMQQLFSPNRFAPSSAQLSPATSIGNSSGNTSLPISRHINDDQLSKSNEASTATSTTTAISSSSTSTLSLQSNNSNNTHLPNGSKAAEELTKRFYLDAVLKSQRGPSSSPPASLTSATTAVTSSLIRPLVPVPLPMSLCMTPGTTTSSAAAAQQYKAPSKHHDHSISALFTPNSENGGCTSVRLKSLRSHDDDPDAYGDGGGFDESRVEDDENNNNHNNSSSSSRKTVDTDRIDAATLDSDCEEDLVVSMTPPHSPAHITTPSNSKTLEKCKKSQEDPIDLSMKPNNSNDSDDLGNDVIANEKPTKSAASKMNLMNNFNDKPKADDSEAATDADDEADEAELEIEVNDESQNEPRSGNLNKEDEENTNEAEGRRDCDDDEDDDNSTVETVKTQIHSNRRNSEEQRTDVSQTELSSRLSHPSSEDNENINSTESHRRKLLRSAKSDLSRCRRNSFGQNTDSDYEMSSKRHFGEVLDQYTDAGNDDSIDDNSSFCPIKRPKILLDCKAKINNNNNNSLGKLKEKSTSDEHLHLPKAKPLDLTTKV